MVPFIGTEAVGNLSRRARSVRGALPWAPVPPRDPLSPTLSLRMGPPPRRLALTAPMRRARPPRPRRATRTTQMRRDRCVAVTQPLALRDHGCLLIAHARGGARGTTLGRVATVGGCCSLKSALKY